MGCCRCKWACAEVSSEDAAGSCAVCLDECTTKACACMWMHRECARKHRRHLGARCTICRRALRRHGLQARPPISETDRQLAAQQTELRVQQRRRTLRTHVAWARRVACALRRLAGQVRDLNTLGVQLRLDEAARNSFAQRLMDLGLTSEQAHDDVALAVSMSDATLPRDVHRRVVRELATRSRRTDRAYAPVSWESD